MFADVKVRYFLLSGLGDCLHGGVRTVFTAAISTSQPCDCPPLWARFNTDALGTALNAVRRSLRTARHFMTLRTRASGGGTEAGKGERSRSPRA